MPGRRRSARSAAAFNLMFKTFMGPVEEDAAVIYLRPETAQGSVRQLQERPAVDAQEAALRHRPDRQELPQRDQPRQLRLPDARVRADGDAVLRPSRRRGAQVFEEWLPRRWAWYTGYGVTEERLRFREHAPDELAHYAKKAIDIEYRFPVRLEGARGHPQPRRLGPGPPPEGERREPRVLRPGHERVVRARGSSRPPADRTARRSRS